MHNHEPKGYVCPICVALEGKENDQTRIAQNDIFYRDESIATFINSRTWPRNPGGVIVIPIQHIENIYDISDELLSKINLFAKKVAIALKETYKCDGTSTRQHNEPAGGQDAWHFHLHVMPRWTNDQLYLRNDEKRWTTPEERKPYADKLKKYFSK